MSPMLSPLVLVGLLLGLLALLSRQLRRPHGWFGRKVMGRLLNQGNRDLLDSVVEAVEAKSGTRVLDVGFGGGYALERLSSLVAPARVAGADFSESMVEAARERWGDAWDLKLADAAQLPFPDGCFDAVISVNTIYFWPDPGRVLRELHRVLRPGGRLLLGYRGGLAIRLYPVTWFGFRLYGDGAVGSMLEQAGFAASLTRPRGDERVAVGRKS